MANHTTIRTLYRLKGVEPTVDAMFDALNHDQLEVIDARLDLPTQLGVPAIVIDGAFEKTEAGWCEDLRRTTGCAVSRPSCRGAALLMFALDEEVYAVGYDQGYRLIPDRLKDRRFGLSFAIRRIDPNEVKDLVRHTPGGGKTDITLVPGGASVRTFGIEEHAQIVRQLGGRLSNVQLTVSERSRARVSSAQGGVGLRLHLGVEGSDLLADVREIARVCRAERPHKDLTFVEHIMPVKDDSLIAQLEDAFDDLLGRPDEGRVVAAVPADRWEDYLAARATLVRINSREGRVSADFDLAYLLDRLRTQRTGSRVAALRGGRVVLYDDSRARSGDTLWSSSAIRWVEADVALGERRFFLLDADWYEIGPAYLRSIRSNVERLIVSSASAELPAWDLAHDEHRFCEDVERDCPGFICMDKKLVRTSLHRGNGVEICDLFGPDNALMMVKRAHRSGSLSHLFKQVLVAVQALQHDPEAKARFMKKIAKAVNGPDLPADFRPQKVVLAILLKNGTELTADTLFPFAQVALVHTATVLEGWGVTVEVVGVGAKPCTCAADGSCAA